MKTFIKENWFKLGILIFLGAVIFLTYHILNKKNPTSPKDTILENTQLNPLINKPHNTYNNLGYGYSISYPESWSRSSSADNEDGAMFYTGDPSSDVRVYATINHGDNLTSNETLILDNGDVSSLSRSSESGNNILRVFINKGEYTYTFYAKGSDSFFKDNNTLLLQVARSLSVKEI